jgi:chromosomal replication initiation ATPase DnaA
MTEEKEIVDLVAKLYKTFKKVGVRNVLNALDGLCRGNINSYDENIISFIKTKVCESFKVETEELNKSFLSNDIYLCRSMSMVLIKKHLNLSHLEISNIFGNKNHTIVSHALSDFKNKNERIKEHKFYLENYNRIYEEVVKYKQTLIQ